MALNSVNPVSSNTNPAAQINQQDFLKLLLAQLNAQNPLKPMDNTAFVAQLAQFSQLQQTQEMTANLNQMLAVQTATQTFALLGRNVAVQSDTSFALGEVTDISFSGNAPLLTVRPSTGSDLTGVGLNQIFNVR